jgi:hypothetical protein
MVILLMAIGAYSCLFFPILLIFIIFVAIGGYFIGGYCWLFSCMPLVVILLLAIDGY